MRAVVYAGFREPIAVADVEDPRPNPDGAVTRVEATGLCRGDWHGWMGHGPDISRFPHVPGHELAGTVEAVGSDVRRVRPGDRVTVSFICACGTCAECVRGEHQGCERQRQPGVYGWGSVAGDGAIPHAALHGGGPPHAADFPAAPAPGGRLVTP